jgi:hypothetical protein
MAEHVPLPSVPKMLLRVASSINDDELVPLHVPPATFLFLHRLGRQCDDSAKPLGRFLVSIHSRQLAEEIVRNVLPPEYSTLRDELDRCQHEKEIAVANQEWERAAALRDETDSLKDRLRQRAHDIIDVQPDHVLEAISKLGFNQPIVL